ncbi:MAG TPA: recombinase RecA, partial [Rubrivivax sp.]
MSSNANAIFASAPEPETLHPALWRAHQLVRPRDAALATGFAELDAELPGGGWPRRVLTELLLPHPGVGEMRLLAPALAAVAQVQRSVMLFDPPAALCGWALGQLGVDVQQLIVVH